VKVAKAAPAIANVIVGTGGHVDHGKTALVKMLTGCDTDRLPEEKRRGMSIDLGFAPCYLADGRVVSIVDVPGHADFIRNMVAGASSIDVLVLVVAADDGVMPQTEEHLRILKLLRAPRVIVALTKIDLVTDDVRALAQEDVRRLLFGLGFAAAPIFPVSNKTGEGVGELRDALDLAVAEVALAKEHAAADDRAFRMDVERVFSVKGYGTVVTGIPVSGDVSVGDELSILPAGQKTTVRTMQSFKYEATTAGAGACVALNLRDVEAHAVARGMTVVAPGAYRLTQDLLVTIENASSATCLRQRTKVKLHAGTASTGASLALVGASELGPGQESFAHVKLDEPLVLATGDRFLVRQLSPAETLGGGVVLAEQAQRVKRSSTLLHQELARARDATAKGDLIGAALFAGREVFVSHEDALLLTHCPKERGGRLLREQEAKGEFVDLDGGGWLVQRWLPVALDKAKKALACYHRDNPHAWGMEPSHLCKVLDVPPKSSARLAQVLMSADAEIIPKNGLCALRSQRPALGERLLSLSRKVAERVSAAGINPPARGNLASELACTAAEMNLVVHHLVGEGVLTAFGTYLIANATLDSCRAALLELFKKQTEVDVATFRAATDASRRVAVAILELFDDQQLTRRTESGRVPWANAALSDAACVERTERRP
jgi:selenocysteine-specific elongation factor